MIDRDDLHGLDLLPVQDSVRLNDDLANLLAAAFRYDPSRLRKHRETLYDLEYAPGEDAR
jgi:hypothetical protein